MTAPAGRVDWSKVRLGEFDALAIIRCPQAIELIEAYWVQQYADRLVIEADSGIPKDPADVGPCRFTDEGREWLQGLQKRYQAAADDTVTLGLARELVSSLGFLVAINVAKAVRALPIPA